ncbi:hypothetical protein AB0878_25190 [Amycolatopsis sp. NPDC047767]|uniref:hypothetical protein n=1 Tax=Amycolatopsis sp. NPDC047767 TaxID=3156765 RepID=UPI0034543B5C
MDELGPVPEPGQKYASTCLAPGAVFAMTWHGGSYADYVDARVVFRQYCCPSCWTALYPGVASSRRTARTRRRRSAITPRRRPAEFRGQCQ